MHIENDFTVELLNGRIFVNGVEYESVVDVDRRLYQAATSLPITDELKRLIAQAIADGRLIERQSAAAMPARIPVISTTER